MTVILFAAAAVNAAFGHTLSTAGLVFAGICWWAYQYDRETNRLLGEAKRLRQHTTKGHYDV